MPGAGTSGEHSSGDEHADVGGSSLGLEVCRKVARERAHPTLTFEPNHITEQIIRLGGDEQPIGTTDYVSIDLDDDFHLAGTVTTTLSDLDRPNLRIDMDVFVGEASGSVDLPGLDNADGQGGHGGDFEVYAYDSDVDSNESPGAIFNQAAIDLSGGNG